MAFDQTTRNRLQRFVNDARRVLEEEFTRQLQNDYGMDPNAGTVADLASLGTSTTPSAKPPASCATPWRITRPVAT